MSDTQKKVKQPKKRKSVKGARRTSNSSASTGRIERIASEAQTKQVSDPFFNLPLDSSFDPSLGSPLDSPSGSFADSDGAVGASGDAFGFPTDSASASSASADSEPLYLDARDYERERSERAAARSRQQAARPRRSPWLWVLAACGLVVCVLLVSIGVFAWDRWLRYDDASDIQGSWIATGTQITIVIDESSIQITEDVAYEYSLNTSDKTITFTFGDMSGSGLYSFSEDRNTLVIDEEASVDIVADFLAFYHLDVLFGLGKDSASQSDDADGSETDEAEGGGTSDDGDQTSSSDEGSLSLTLERLS